MDLQELREQRAKLVKQARDMLNDAGDGGLDGEGEARYKEVLGKVSDLKKQITQEENLRELEAELERPAGPPPNKPEVRTREQQREAARRARETRESKDVDIDAVAERFDLSKRNANYLREMRKHRGGGPEGVDERFATFLRSETEIRALQADSDTAGGYLVPDVFLARLIQNVDDRLFMRQLGNVLPSITGESLGVPTLENDPADPEWTAEVATGSEDTTMSLGKRELKPHPLAQRIKVSRKLLRASAIDVAGLVAERMGEKFAVVQEKGFLQGSGSQQPLGVFTASADGIPTSRDVSKGNDSTSITFDGFKSAKYSLKLQYRRAAVALFHRDGIEQISKLKDGNGQYLWQPSQVADEPDRIGGIPVFESEYVPNTFTTGQYVGIIGDFSNYWIVDALNLTMQRLDELYAETNQTGFIGRLETDGAPVRSEAFVRIKLA